ncbi:Ubiquitin-binding protein CUE5 [Nakaseomyces bracarensis]|uniref:Ubiquitin-binding protein CUE5 n=1 Tax=Nakaseomyces bracarensis TaxID=273131 RepID=A0ABR4NXI6_9SACH
MGKKSNKKSEGLAEATEPVKEEATHTKDIKEAEKDNVKADKEEIESLKKEEGVSEGTVQDDEHAVSENVKDSAEGKDLPAAEAGSKLSENSLPAPEALKEDQNPLLKELQDAFPNMEEKYIKAVIIASQGALDPAFNALLFLSDPESGKDIELPSQPLKETPSLPPRRKQTQLEHDEMLARQLDEQYNRRRKSRPHNNSRGHERRQYGTDHFDGEEDDSWSQFVEKDLPEITARAKGSLQETATKVGSWFNGVKKNFIGENDLDNDGAYYRDDAHGRDLDEQYGTYVQQQEVQQRRGVHEPGYRRGDEHRLNARHRFNSFGASVNDEDDERGISMHDDDDDFNDDDDDEVPPQLPTRSKENEEVKPQESKKEKLVAQNNALIDTPDKEKEKTKRKWQPLPPEPLEATPTKVNAKKTTNESEDEFLINSDED